jgi:hypothetical protein
MLKHKNQGVLEIPSSVNNVDGDLILIFSGISILIFLIAGVNYISYSSKSAFSFSYALATFFLTIAILTEVR